MDQSSPSPEEQVMTEKYNHTSPVRNEDHETGIVPTPLPARERRRKAHDKREKAFALSNRGPLPVHRNNGEEAEYLSRYGFPVSSFSKGLPHNERGEVECAAYRALLHALKRGREEDFAHIPRGSNHPLARRFIHPQAGLGFDLSGPDAQHLILRPAPCLDERKHDGEMVELYWMALLRDVSFIDYEQEANVDAAARELNLYRDDLDVSQAECITPRTLFRGSAQAALVGPYLSQFLLQDARFGALDFNQRQRSLARGSDHLMDFGSWLASQNGAPPQGREVFDPTPHYIRNLRDLANYVHRDPPYMPYLMAFNCINVLLANAVASAPPGSLPPFEEEGLPYPFPDFPDPVRRRNQEGFTAFSPMHLLALLGEVTTRALKASWFQKWFVHRRLRPEEYAGRVDVHRRELARYPVSNELLSSQAHQRTVSQFGSSLLPQAYPEGAPLHPAYSAGHAASAGACITILKAFINDRWPWPGDQVVVPNREGTELVAYTGSDAGNLTVGGELDKLAANIALARSAAGIHWRSDALGIQQGEQIALQMLAEQSILFNEEHHYTVTGFDGRTWRIKDGCIEQR
jgi:hypothetical protein